MKKLFLKFTLFGVLCLLAGCSESDVPCDAQGDAAELSGDVISGIGTFDPDEVDGMFQESPGTRTELQYDKLINHIKFCWKKGERVPVYMCFKQRDKQKIVKSEVVIKENNKVSFLQKIPAGFNRRSGDLYIGAAMGKQPGVNNGAWATGLTADGQIRIEMADEVDAASNEYNLPFYVPLTRIDESGDIFLQFKSFGSWIVARVKINENARPNHFVVNSDVVSTTGKLDLLNSEGRDAKWTPDPLQTDNIRFKVKNFEVKAGEEAQPLLMWFAPILDHKSKQPTTVSVGIGGTEHEAARYVTRDTGGKCVNFENNSVSSFRLFEKKDEINPLLAHDLVISAYHSNLKRSVNRSILQITNATDHDIDLRGYYLVRSVYGSPETPSGVIDLGNLEKNGAKFLYNDREKRILPSGASLLVTGYTEWLASRTFDGYKGRIYQIALLGENANLLNEFAPVPTICREVPNNSFCNAFFITRNGTNISIASPNDIVDNFGRDANGKIYRFPFLNITYYRVPYYNARDDEQGLAGPATYRYNLNKVMHYEGTFKGPMVAYESCAWRYANENKLTSLGMWAKYGDIKMKRNNMYPKDKRRR